MASELVNSATSDKLSEIDWAKNIEICELVARDQRQAKDVIKAIKKRLGSKSTNTQLYAVMLLEMLMNNIGEAVHKQVVEAGLLPILVKIVKKKSDLPIRERIFLLLDATQTSTGGATGRFPQYYSAYYELVSAGVKFPQRTPALSTDHPSSGASQNTLAVANVAPVVEERATRREETQPTPGSSIIEKASAALEVLREVLDAVNAQNPEAAKDEFTLDLVEQCSFQKDRVMHLVMSSRDERLVSQAIELNDQLEKLLARHEALVKHGFSSTEIPVEHHGGPPPTSNHVNHVGRGTWASNHNNHVGQPTSAPNHINHVGQPTAAPNHINHVGQPTSAPNHINHVGQPASAPNHINYVDNDESEEEEAEQLSHRRRKGKAQLRPEEEDGVVERPFGLLSSSNSSERLHRPLIRPLTLEPPSPDKAPPPATLIPPPPAKHVEREKFFQEKRGDGTPLAGHMRGLSLHSRNASGSSFTGSIGSNE